MSLPEPLRESDFPEPNLDKAQLGQLLFYDNILSGNRNISCGSCHHHDHAGSDGLSLGIGEGGSGVGLQRVGGIGAGKIRRRISRNAPSLWNLGAHEIKILFHDGRLSRSDDYENGFNSPAEERLPEGLESLLAVQALFPLTSRKEMAGDPEENSVARAAFDRIDHVWPIITARIQQIDGYVQQFVSVFEHINSAGDITIADIANSLAEFIALEWRSLDSPMDDYLGGDEAALTDAQLQGLSLFYGKANCSACHSGPLFTDQSFHALGLPTFGPGRNRRYDPIPRDVGRMAETDRREDAYRFRTPSLRNVALTSPYGHNGAYRTLEGIVRHHLDPAESRKAWTPQQANLPDISWLNKSDFIIQQDGREMQRYNLKLDIETVSLTDDEIGKLVTFLQALTGKSANQTPLGRPDSVPSGLPVD
ncbi:MAG: cytochrome-c peroxidase [Granulosicoccus sp.]